MNKVGKFVEPKKFLKQLLDCLNLSNDIYDTPKRRYELDIEYDDATTQVF